MKKKRTINLDDYFQPREYQKPMMRAFYEGYKRIIVAMPRRSGKDFCALTLRLEAAIARVGLYWYVWPQREQGRKGAWNGKTNDGLPFLSLIPAPMIKSTNISDMRIDLWNGSIIQIVGTENVDNLMGANPCGIVFTEYAIANNQRAFELILPMLIANDGWCIIISTPRGRNAFYELLQVAKDNPEKWWWQILTLDDTKHVSQDVIDEMIKNGEMSYELAQQEFWCSFDLDVAGIVYGGALDRLKSEGRLTTVHYDAMIPVHTAWDIGRDTTAIIFFQVDNLRIHIIDYYEKENENLEYFVRYLQAQPYAYGKHFFPHDGIVVEWSGPKYSRRFKAERLGLSVEIVPRVLLEDGIEWTRAQLGKCYIDEKKCEKLVKCLENYRYVRNEKLGVNSVKPLHDWASHGASAMMYLALSLELLTDQMTEADAERIRREAIYGSSDNTPYPFKELKWNYHATR